MYIPFRALDPGDDVLGTIEADARAQARAGPRPNLGEIECPVRVQVDTCLGVFGHGGRDVRRRCEPVFWVSVQDEHRPAKRM